AKTSPLDPRQRFAALEERQYGLDLWQIGLDGAPLEHGTFRRCQRCRAGQHRVAESGVQNVRGFTAGCLWQQSYDRGNRLFGRSVQILGADTVLARSVDDSLDVILPSLG